MWENVLDLVLELFYQADAFRESCCVFVIFVEVLQPIHACIIIIILTRVLKVNGIQASANLLYAPESLWLLTFKPACMHTYMYKLCARMFYG